jgi:hypothetical protein
MVIEGAVNIRILKFYDVSVVIATCNGNIEGKMLQHFKMTAVIQSRAMPLGATFAYRT